MPTPTIAAQPARIDRDLDGCFVGARGLRFSTSATVGSVPPVLPNNGAPIVDRIVYVCGIMTDRAREAADMQALANTGASVVAIRNPSRGMASDLFECAGDYTGAATHDAVATTARIIVDAVTSERPLHLAGHSQGALIIARALDQALVALRASGLSASEIDRRLDNVRVETFGGAAFSFVDGPRYVHYVNTADPVPVSFGLGATDTMGHPGRGAVIVRFTSARAPGFSMTDGFEEGFARSVDAAVHGPRDVYFPRRRAFDVARAR